MNVEEEKVRVGIITHKNVNNYIVKKGYLYIYVGGYKVKQKKEEYVYDDIGVNISKKNPNYCELTGLYWMWKNLNAEIMGLVHYRRFFTKNSLSSDSKFFYSDKEIEKMLKRYDLIVPKRCYVKGRNIVEHYDRYHYKKDIYELRKVISDIYPDYLIAYDEAFNKNYFYPCNMFIANKSIMNNYCEWLFSILKELESRIDISSYDNQQARIFGFISERMMNVWIIKNNIRIKEAAIVQLDSSIKYRFRLYLDRFFKTAICEN